MERREADVAVVGAGLAGLATARALAVAGLSVEVLEARDRAGGRILNQEIGDGKVVEMGGQWVGPTQDRMYKLAAELGVETYPTYDTGKFVGLIGGKRYVYSGDLPRMNPIAVADFAQAVMRIERMARRVMTDRPWETKRAGVLDAQTLESWIRRNLRTNAARALLRTYMESVFATEASNFSLLHALFYIRSGTSFETLVRTSGGAQQDRFLGGSQLLAIRMAEQLGGSISLGAPVRSIDQSGSAVVVSGDRLTVEAKRAVVAIPPALAGRIRYEPPMPGFRDQLTQRLPQGSVVKVNVVYEEPFWRSEGLKGQGGSTELPVSFTFDNSPPGGAPGILAAFLEGAAARRFGREDPEVRRRVVLSCLERYYGARASHAAGYHELDWSEEEWTRGCYGAHFPPGVWTQYGPALAEPVDRIHWAGAETAAVWNGYMEGAVRSGERAAGEVIRRLG